MQPSTLLVVTSSQNNFKALGAFLDALGVDAQLAPTPGSQALAKALKSEPGLIIIDLSQDDKNDAFQLIHLLRQAKALKETTLFGLVAQDDASGVDNAFAAGVTDILSLPLRGSEIVNRVRVHLERNRYKEAAIRYQDGVEEGVALARQLQESLLPTSFGISEIERAFGLQLDYYFEASSSVGGDLWGIHRLNEHQLGLFSIDFSGHGVAAALNCFRFYATMSENPPIGSDPAAYLTALNKFLRPEIRRGQFATMFYGILDCAANELIYAGAGTPGPVIGEKARRESFRCLDASGMPLGISDNATYQNHRVPFGPGSFLLLYSDALIEATQILNHEPLGEEGIMGFLSDSIYDFSDGLPPLDGLVGHFFERIEWAELPDDLTTVWLYRPTASEAA